jgi:hypothetical protein
MTLKNLNPLKPRAAFGSWEWELECEERSLDHLHEILRRSSTAARAVLALKTKLICAGLRIKLTAKEHAMVAADFVGWARAETDPEKASLGISAGRRRNGRLLRRQSGRHGNGARGPNPCNPHAGGGCVSRPGRIA